MDPGTGGVGRAEVRLNRPAPRLYLVTSRETVSRPGFQERAVAALEAGGSACALQLRAHGLPGRAFWELACRLKAAALGAGASLWINDRVDVALVVRSEGVQLGARSMSAEEARRLLGRACRIGLSVHSAEEAGAAFAEGAADLVVLGTIYATASHPGRAPLGLKAVEGAAASGRPIVAIGGIRPERVVEVLEAGAFGVAASSGVWASEDPGAEVSRYLAALEAALNERAGGEARA